MRCAAVLSTIIFYYFCCFRCVPSNWQCRLSASKLCVQDAYRTAISIVFCQCRQIIPAETSSANPLFYGLRPCQCGDDGHQERTCRSRNVSWHSPYTPTLVYYCYCMNLPDGVVGICAGAQHYLIHVVSAIDFAFICQTDVGVLGCSHLERDRGSAVQRHAGIDVRISTQREVAIFS